jgi:hypothetical protein
MSSIQTQSIDAPHETRQFQAHGHLDVVTLGDFTLGRATFEPGWRWSEDDGTEATMGPGDVVTIEPGHDAWVDGDEACVFLDTGVAAYAKPA